MNLTIMLVMTTIFTSKIEALPPTSDTKMIDAWLIFSLLIPFAAVVIQTAIECYRYTHNVMLQSANAMISTLSTTHTTNRESCDLFVKLKFVPSRDEEEEVQRGKSQTVAKILARTGGHHQPLFIIIQIVIIQIIFILEVIVHIFQSSSSCRAFR